MGSRSPRELIDPAAKRLILLITDCASSAWDRAPLWQTIEEWGARSPVVIFHMLPERLWPSTGLGTPSISVRSEIPGAPNQLLLAEYLGWDFNEGAASRCLSSRWRHLPFTTGREWSWRSAAQVHVGCGG